MSAALILRGYAFRHVGRTRSWGIDYRKCIESHRKYLIEPLVERYGRCDIFLTTYLSEGLPKEQLKLDYQPDFFTAIPEGPSQRQTAVKALDEVIEAWDYLKRYEQVVMTRFDVEILTNPFELPNYDPICVNFLWREWNQASWQDHRRVPDSLFMFHGEHLKAFRDGVVEAPSEGCLHLIYYPVEKKVGSHNLNVMNQEGYTDSNTDIMPNNVYKLVRVQ